MISKQSKTGAFSSHCAAHFRPVQPLANMQEFRETSCQGKMSQLSLPTNYSS